MRDINKRVIAESGIPGTVIVLPGILARVQQQYRPLIRVLKQYGRVVGFNYDSRLPMNSQELINTVAGTLVQAKKRGEAVLIGSSMGGMQVPFVVEKYCRMNPGDDLSWLRSIICDAPTGAKTLKQVPPGAAMLLGSRLALRVLATGFGDNLVAKMSQPPKDDEITIPSSRVMYELAGRAYSDESWRAWVKDTARADLSGYSGILFWSWLHWMISVGRNQVLERAAQSLQGVDTTYMACIHPGNGVVAQPQAADQWKRWLPNAQFVEVVATHCGYLQNQPEFAKAFEEALVAHSSI